MHVSYLEWYIKRINDDNCTMLIESLENIFEKTLDKPIMIFPLSHAPNHKKFNVLYSCPIIPFLAVNKTVHGIYNHPCWQIQHDVYIHGKDIVKNYVDLGINLQDYTNVFAVRTKILQNIFDANSPNLDILFFDLIHEQGLYQIVFMLYGENKAIPGDIFFSYVHMKEILNHYLDRKVPYATYRLSYGDIIEASEKTKASLFKNRIANEEEFAKTYRLLLDILDKHVPLHGGLGNYARKFNKYYTKYMEFK